jgi:hypothetical protein
MAVHSTELLEDHRLSPETADSVFDSLTLLDHVIHRGGDEYSLLCRPGVEIARCRDLSCRLQVYQKWIARLHGKPPKGSASVVDQQHIGDRDRSKHHETLTDGMKVLTELL